jgi:biopolymer transport protein ExbB
MNIVVINAWQLFFRGGPMMWPILVLSVMAVAVGVNKILALAKIERRLRPGQKTVLEKLRAGQLKEALALCDTMDSPVGEIAKAGILSFGSPREILRGQMEEALLQETADLRRHMDILGLSINIAPLMGLLGTICAMTVVFHAVQVRSNLLNPLTAGELASGIWQALLTTAFGLIVAIFSLTMHTFCAMRINNIASYLQRATLEIVNVLTQMSQLKASAGEQGHE